MYSAAKVCEQVNRYCPPMNTILQLSAPYTNPQTSPPLAPRDIWQINLKHTYGSVTYLRFSL